VNQRLSQGGNFMVRWSKRWRTSTTSRSGRRRILDRSFQERWQNEAERKEKRGQMLDKRRQERWRIERRNERVYTNEDLRRCWIWLLKHFWSMVEARTHYWMVDVICNWASMEMLTLATYHDFPFMLFAGPNF
jgi:hypothetical protein